MLTYLQTLGTRDAYFDVESSQLLEHVPSPDTCTDVYTANYVTTCTCMACGQCTLLRGLDLLVIHMTYSDFQ